MKTQKTIDNTKLGIFVLAGLLFLILLLYMIGRNRNLLGSRFTVHALISNVNGLVPGNNVRFKGIDVGTVKAIDLQSDSTIVLTLIIDEEVKRFIRTNAVASIGSDGLMGNKLFNLNPGKGGGTLVNDGDTISAVNPIASDMMLRTLDATNKNIGHISGNLLEITTKLNRSNGLWTILSDSMIATDLKAAVAELHRSGKNATQLTETANAVVTRIEGGNGIAYQLFMDTTLSKELSEAVHDINNAAQTTSDIMDKLNVTVTSMNEGDGTAGLVLKDSAFRAKLDHSLTNIEEGSHSFNQNMDAMKRNFLFRGYFRRLEKQRQKELNASTKK